MLALLRLNIHALARVIGAVKLGPCMDSSPVVLIPVGAPCRSPSFSSSMRLALTWIAW